MAIHRVFAAIEHWPLSIWMREDAYAYFVALIFHAFGMALLVGAGIVISLRFLGAARDSNLRRYRGFHVVMWLGAALAIVSGLLLLCAYPAKALTSTTIDTRHSSASSGSLRCGSSRPRRKEKRDQGTSTVAPTVRRDSSARQERAN